MPRFRPHAHPARGAAAALLLALVLLSGCSAATAPAEGGQGLPNPFAPGLPTPTNTPGVYVTPSVTLTSTPLGPASTATAALPTATPTWTATAAPPGSSPTATAPSSTATPATVTPSVTSPPSTAPPSTATQTAATQTPRPGTQATPLPSATLLPPAAQTRTVPTVPADTPASPPTATPMPTSTAAATATWTPAPSPTREEPVDWDLARDVIGMWEFVDGEGWRYYFDFLPGGRVIVEQNGVRTYLVRDARTLLIQLPDDEWTLTVLDLTADYITLSGFTPEPQAFYRVPGTPDLASWIFGLWLDESGVFPSIEFATDGLAAGEFGRGTYEVPSDNFVLITCAPSLDCDPYREYGQGDAAPLKLRIHGVTDDTLTVEGLGSSQQWTLTYHQGIPNLADRLVGRWERGSEGIEFEGDGDLVRLLPDGELYGRWEVLGRSTFWIEYEGQEEGHSWVVMRLTATELAFAEWGAFYEDDLYVFEREASTQ